MPRPKHITREFIRISQDVRAINGKEGRDISSRKEKFTLGWEILAESEFNKIKGIVDGHAPVVFKIAEDNLVVNETDVFVEMKSAGYTVPGSDYIVSTEIELIEVE